MSHARIPDERERGAGVAQAEAQNMCDVCGAKATDDLYEFRRAPRGPKTTMATTIAATKRAAPAPHCAGQAAFAGRIATAIRREDRLSLLIHGGLRAWESGVSANSNW
jgi:hypothetical protein